MNDSSSSPTPFKLLIAALGGEGGGLLSKWIASAAEIAGHRVQHTSVPGVAQRTGATIYYIESLALSAIPEQDQPVFNLMPGPGDVDVVLASEWVEAGRILQRGFAAADRTTLIASTHRVISLQEKMVTTDGRLDTAPIYKACEELTQRQILVDIKAIASAMEAPPNAILLGLLAASAASPYPIDAFRAAISTAGIAVDDNLRGFDAGMHAYTGESLSQDTPPEQHPKPPASVLALPAEIQDVAARGVERLTDYMDVTYAQEYLKRLQRIVALDDGQHHYALTSEVARHLALWMSYEDIMRVAQLKLKPERWQRLAQEARKEDDDIMVVTEFFKPGLEEWCAVLPASLGRRLQNWSVRNGHTLQREIQLNSSSILGTLLLKTLAASRCLRRRGLRFAHEHRRIDHWLSAIESAAQSGTYDLAQAIAACAQINKGYGDTQQRGASNLEKLLGLLPKLPNDGRAAQVLNRLRQAALADPDQDMDSVIKSHLVEIIKPI